METGVSSSALLRQLLRRGCRELRFEHAAESYRRGDISLSRAAEIADVTLRQFILRMPDAHLELQYKSADLRLEFEGASS